MDATDSNSGGNVVLALCEGKERNEVGMAILDVADQPILYLAQHVDNFWFSDTLRKIFSFNIQQIVRPDVVTNPLSLPKLCQYIHEKFPHIRTDTLPAKTFDVNVGMEHINSLCAIKYVEDLVKTVRKKPCALASVAALLDYCKTRYSVSFMEKSLRIQYLAPQNSLKIDVDTLDRLELVTKIGSTSANRTCIYGLLNFCKTKIGRTSLRSSILEPSCDLQTILERQMCVTELINAPKLLFNIQSEMKNFHDIHKLMKLPYALPEEPKQKLKMLERKTDLIFILKQVLEHVQDLKSSLQETKSSFLRFILDGISRNTYSFLLTEINSAFEPNTRIAEKSQAFFQKLYAIKAEKHPFLIILRQHLSKFIDDIRLYVSNIAEQSNLPLKMTHNSSKGFHIQLSLTKATESSVFPPTLEVINRTARTVTFTDNTICVYNTKIQKIIHEIQVITNNIIFNLLGRIQEHIHHIYFLIDILAELDVIQSLAEYSKRIEGCCPTFGEETQLNDAIHPLLQHKSNEISVKHNSFLATPEYNFFLVVGENMSGKTVYIKTLATIQILAQMGCYVPAKLAKLRLCDKLLSRIGFEDNIEANASSFLVEMREMEFIIRTITPNSLVIIDELFRSTNVKEAYVLSWCFCEKLIKYLGFNLRPEENTTNLDAMKIKSVIRPVILVTTHFDHLLKLAEKYHNVINLLVKDQVVNAFENSASQIPRERLKVAKTVRLPQSVIKNAETILNNKTLDKWISINESLIPKNPVQTSRGQNASNSRSSKSISSILTSPGSHALYGIFSLVANACRHPDSENQLDASKPIIVERFKLYLEAYGSTRPTHKTGMTSVRSRSE